MEHRWWVTPELNYALPPPGSIRDPDFEQRPKFTPKSETFAVGKIAQWIYSGNLGMAIVRAWSGERGFLIQKF
jgi:hypothetical protein